MKYILKIVVLGLLVLACVQARAQDSGYDVFNPISKYLRMGAGTEL